MTTIFLIPGVLCDSSLWDQMLPLLKEKFDIRYSHIPKENSITAMATAVVNDIPPKSWLVGFSLGGWIALEAAHLAPERIKGLILISTNDGTLSDSTRASMQAAVKKMRHGQFQDYIKETLSLYLTEEHTKDPVICQSMLSMMKTVGSDIGSAQYEAMLHLDKPFDFIPTIKLDTLIIRGEQDKRRTLEMDQAFYQKFPNAQFSIIPDAAHFIPIEQPHILANKIIKFITEHN